MKKFKQTFDLDARDLEIMRLNALEGMTNQQTADALDVSLSTVKRAKAKKSYSELAKSALESQGYAIAEYVKDLIEMTKAEKVVFEHGHQVKVPDYSARHNASKLISGIFGTDAPKDSDRRTGVDNMSDEDIIESLAKSLYEYKNVTTNEYNKPESEPVDSDTGSEATIPQNEGHAGASTVHTEPEQKLAE